MQATTARVIEVALRKQCYLVYASDKKQPARTAVRHVITITMVSMLEAMI